MNSHFHKIIFLVLVFTSIPFIQDIPLQAQTASQPIATFSIVARDSATGELGVAVASRFFAVGSVVPWARADVGAVATQSFSNTSFGWRGLDLLEKSTTPEE